MQKNTYLLILTIFSFITLNAQTTFNWDTNEIDNGDNITETIDGITLTVTEDTGMSIVNGGGNWGSSGNVIATEFSNPNPVLVVTFTFSEPVMVNRLLLYVDIYTYPIQEEPYELTFTPTGGSNTPVVFSGHGESFEAVLEWTDITSFTIESTSQYYSPAFLAFDNLLINDSALSNLEFSTSEIKLFPNPVTSNFRIDNTKKEVTALQIYNSQGQLLREVSNYTNQNVFIGDLANGLYFINLISNNSINTVKIIKQ